MEIEIYEIYFTSVEIFQNFNQHGDFFENFD